MSKDTEYPLAVLYRTAYYNRFWSAVAPTSKENKMKKIKGLKKVVGEINANRDLFCTVLLDSKTNELWCDGFPSGNSWNEYRNPSIKFITRIPSGIFDNYRHITMAEIREAVKEVLGTF